MPPLCLKPMCPKPGMALLLSESNWTHKEWFCPGCGMKRTEVTKLGKLGSLAPPTMCVSAVIAIGMSVASLLHGDVDAAHEMLDLPEDID